MSPLFRFCWRWSSQHLKVSYKKYEKVRGCRSSSSWRPRAVVLAERMTKLGTAISEAIIYNYGTSAFLSRLSDPFWFQAFGSVMGMDWHHLNKQRSLF
jgi:hypothetical protein